MMKFAYVFFLLGLLPGGPAEAWAAPRDDRCVILISLDGLPAFFFDDTRIRMPTLRRMAREGARASGMVCSFPTVTWPNHTTLVTGVSPDKHGVIGNSYFDRKSQKVVPFIPDPLFDKDEIVKVPTIYDVAHERGLKTAGIVWPATRRAATLDWTVPDMAGDDAWTQFGTRTWLDELRAENVPVDRHGRWVREAAGGVQRDWLYARMAEHVLLRHSPNLLLIHLVETDHVEHRFGPHSAEAQWAASYADDRVREILEAAERSSMKGKTTIFVCSDHGFFDIRREIRPNVLLKRLGYIEEGKPPAKPKRAFCLSQGGGCAVYLMDDERRDEDLRRLSAALSGLEGVEAAVQSDEFGRLGQPTRDEDPRAADLWLSAKEGYSFSDSTSGDEPVVARDSVGGTHGYLPENPDLFATCVIWGSAIRGGVDLGKIRNVDIAPTIAAILAINMPPTDGKPLTECLLDPR